MLQIREARSSLSESFTALAAEHEFRPCIVKRFGAVAMSNACSDHPHRLNCDDHTAIGSEK